MASETQAIQSKENNMEYIIFLTYRCNLRCPYCFASNVVFNQSPSKYCLSDENIRQLTKFIRHDISRRYSKDNSIVFFGGEPTLALDTIDYIIKETSDLNLKYSIYTNGLLLDTIPQHLLSKLNTILVAIDGDKRAHETYKPIGSYDKVIRAVQKIRGLYPGELIARITMEENTNIYESVTNLLKDFDFVHWQIVNKPSFNNSKALIESYTCNINKLVDFWIDAMAGGVIYNIIPFNEIMLRLISADLNDCPSFLCGCGKDVMAIDVEGRIYQCDEYINKPNGSISSIFSQDRDVDLNYKSHTELFDDCKTCNISSICLGRCRKALETCSTAQIRTYCSLTHILIEKLATEVESVRNIITHNQWSINCFPHSIYKTEIIP